MSKPAPVSNLAVERLRRIGRELAAAVRDAEAAGDDQTAADLAAVAGVVVLARVRTETR